MSFELFIRMNNISTSSKYIKKIYEDDVEYGSWKKNWKKRKEMIFEVVNTSGRKTRKKQRGGGRRRKKKTRKKRGGTMNDKDRGKRRKRKTRKKHY